MSEEKHQKQSPWHRNLHKDWRLWAMVALMIALLFYYLATFDLAQNPDATPVPMNVAP